MNTLNYVRPMGTRELFSSSFRLYKTHFGKLFLINLVQVILVFVLNIFSYALGVGGTYLAMNTQSYWWIAITLLISLIPSIIGIFVGAAMVIATSNAVLGRVISVRDSYKRAWSAKLIGKMLIISFPFSIAYTLAILIPLAVLALTGSPLLVLCLLPIEIASIIIIITILVFVSPVVILEKKNVFKTISRVFTLFWGNMIRIIINYMFLWYIPVYIITYIFSLCIYLLILYLLFSLQILDSQLSAQAGILVGSSLGLLIGSVVGIPFGMFLNPFGATLSILLYYDSRARKENYNETILAEEMGYAPVGEMI